MTARRSYGEILRATGIMGSSALIVLFLGFARNKIAAVFLGTTGIGILASFVALQSLLVTLVGLGIGTSSVREIAKANSQKEPMLVSKLSTVLVRLSWIFGFAGLGIILVASSTISNLTFGNSKYQLDVAGLGLVVLFSNLASAQIAMLQGARKIPQIAKVNIMGGVVALAASIPLYLTINLRGIVPVLILASIGQYLSGQFFVSRLDTPKIRVTWAETLESGKSMIILGFSMMWSSLLVSAVGVLAITLINFREGISFSGYYGAAITISGIFVGFILSSMSTDFFPRLVGALEETLTVKRLVNEQTEIGVLLALPGLTATLLFAPMLVELLYSSDFLPAVPLLQLLVISSLCRVVSWPLGFVVLTAGKSGWFFVSETIFGAVQAALLLLLVPNYGVEGAAISFLIGSLFYSLFIYLMVYQLFKIQWSKGTTILVAFSVAVVILAFLLARYSPPEYGNWIGIPFVVLTFIYSLRGVVQRFGKEHPMTIKLFKIPGIRIIFFGIHR